MHTHQTAEHADGLSLNVWHLTSMVKGHVGGLPVGIFSGFGQSLRVEVVGHDLALVWRLWGEQVPRNLLQGSSITVERCGRERPKPGALSLFVLGQEIDWS